MRKAYLCAQRLKGWRNKDTDKRKENGEEARGLRIFAARGTNMRVRLLKNAFVCLGLRMAPHNWGDGGSPGSMFNLECVGAQAKNLKQRSHTHAEHTRMHNTHACTTHTHAQHTHMHARHVACVCATAYTSSDSSMAITVGKEGSAVSYVSLLACPLDVVDIDNMSAHWIKCCSCSSPIIANFGDVLSTAWQTRIAPHFIPFKSTHDNNNK
eukprot:scaffold18260_cov18-Tisochrysis_lutea.AAC.1